MKTPEFEEFSTIPQRLRLFKQLSRSVDNNTLLRRYQLPSTLSEGPLQGLSFVVKDNIEVAGEPLTFGLSLPLKPRCLKSAGVVAKLQKLGAVLLGSANLDPAALGCTGINPTLGTITNPIYPAYSCGGSSSGCAAAVANNLCDFAIGTDFGGSVRLPAAQCGLSSIKLPPLIFPRDGVTWLSPTMDSFGLITRKAIDLYWLLDQLLSAPGQPIGLVTPANIIDNLVFYPYQQAWGKLINRLQLNNLVEIIPYDLGLDRLSKLRKQLAAWSVSISLNTIPKENKPPALMAIEQYANSLDVTLVDKLTAEAQILSLNLQQQLKSKNSLLLLPTLPYPLACDNEATDELLRWLVLANLTEWPAVSMPIDPVTTEHPPCSIQIIGNCQDLANLIATARMISQHFNDCT